MMTRDEQRAACCKAIMACMGWKGSPGKKLASQRILDSLHGLARVCPGEATEEMMVVGANVPMRSITAHREVYRAMSAAGDLTNGPEGKE